MNLDKIKEITQKYHTLTKLMLGTVVVFFNIIFLFILLYPKLIVLFPKTPGFIVALHFVALFFLWCWAALRLMNKKMRDRTRVECIMLISSFCEVMYDRLADLIDFSNNTKKIKRALNHVYTVNFFIYDRLYNNKNYVVEFKESFSRLTDETVVIVGMIEADKDISENRVDEVITKIDELKYLLHERVQNESI